MIVWYVCGLMSIQVMGLIVSKTEDKISHLLSIALILPITGRVMGWW